MKVIITYLVLALVSINLLTIVSCKSKNEIKTFSPKELITNNSDTLFLIVEKVCFPEKNVCLDSVFFESDSISNYNRNIYVDELLNSGRSKKIERKKSIYVLEERDNDEPIINQILDMLKVMEKNHESMNRINFLRNELTSNPIWTNYFFNTNTFSSPVNYNSKITIPYQIRMGIYQDIVINAKLKLDKIENCNLNLLKISTSIVESSNKTTYHYWTNNTYCKGVIFDLYFTVYEKEFLNLRYQLLPHFPNLNKFQIISK